MENCSEAVWDQGGWPRQHACPRKASVERDGKWYCAQHDPVKKAARRNKADDRYKAESDYRQSRVALCNAAIAFVDTANAAELAAAVARFQAAKQACAETGVQLWRML